MKRLLFLLALSSLPQPLVFMVALKNYYLQLQPFMRRLLKPFTRIFPEQKISPLFAKYSVHLLA